MVAVDPPQGRLGRAMPFALLVFVIVAVWGRSVTFEFVFWDDAQLIYENAHVVPPDLATLAGSWKSHHAGMYIPVVYNVWWAIAQLSRWVGGPFAQYGTPPWAFHLANVVVHIISTCLVLSILCRIGLPKWPSVLGASVFAIHPIQAEAVCWSTGMKDLLSTALALGSVSLCLRASARWRSDARAAHFCYSGALLLAFAGSLAKPGILGLPLIAAALDAGFVGGFTRATVLRALGLAAVLAPSVIWTSLAQPVSYASGVSVLLRPTVALHALGFYTQKLFVPSGLAIDYGLRPLIVVTQWKHLLVAMIPPVLLLVLLAARGHRKPLIIAGLVFLGGVGPVLGLVPFGFQFWSTVADRYVYMAMLGPAIAATYLFSLLSARISVLAGVSLVCGLAWLSIHQAAVWHDTVSLMDNTIRINGSSAVAYNNYATAFCPTPAMDNGILTTPKASGGLTAEQQAEMVELADQYFTKAFLLRPEYPDPLRNMIWNRAGRGQYREAIALSELAFKLNSVDVLAHVIPPYNLGWIYMQERQDKKACQMFLIALALDPNNDQARRALVQTAGRTDARRRLE